MQVEGSIGDGGEAWRGGGAFIPVGKWSMCEINSYKLPIVIAIVIIVIAIINSWRRSYIIYLQIRLGYDIITTKCIFKSQFPRIH